ncbi:MAG TPA: hypothetical protein VJA25_13470, partial [Dehalococcoidia bacterium]|nr:hypothetical protein [Dehalococcoidia bacterium]
MPLIGLIDPSHDERKAAEPGRLPRWFPRDELLARFETASPKYSPYTYEVVSAALDQWQDRDYVSTTMLVGGCARSKVLERTEDFILDLDSLWPAFRGTQTHRTLEFSARPHALAEARFFTTLYVTGYGDIEVSCSPDLVTANPAAVVDYKAPTDDRSIPSYGYPWKDHVNQLQYNRYIVNHAERWELADDELNMPWDPRALVFERLYVVYLGTRGPKVIECQKSIPWEFKNGNMGTKKVPDVWPDDQVEDDMLPRLTAMLRALEAYPDWPVGLEKEPGFEGTPGWACPGKPWCKLPDCLAKRYPYGLR